MDNTRPQLLVASLALCLACTTNSQTTERSAPPEQTAPMTESSPGESSPGGGGGTTASSPQAPELDPGRGQDIGMEFEAFLSPHQEPGEESDTPPGTPKAFRSTTPSKTRAEREAAGHRGHGKVRFSNDLSRAYIDVKIAGIAPETINMFHIHCGKPGILGPILVDLGLSTDIQKHIASGVLSVVVTNKDIVKTANHGHGLVAAFTAGCVMPDPSLGGIKPTKVSTVSGMAHIAAQGELYFNLHTTGQTFYGDIRGQIVPLSK